jgi:peptidoglycan/xylan/chitin deacetylase (PgdA/CDA1 family)
MRSWRGRRVLSKCRIAVVLRRLVAACCFYTGINALFRLVCRRGQGVVLMYHRVVDTGHLHIPDTAFLHPGMYVSSAAFERQMRYLSRHYRVMEADAFVAAMRAGGAPANCCVITFDDGWKDNYTQALPVLAKYGLPACVFVVADYLGTTRWFWPERASFALASWLAPATATSGEERSRRAVFQRPDLGPIVRDRRLDLEEKVVRALEVLRNLPADERDQVVAELERAAPAQRTATEPDRLLLTWSEAAAMRAQGVAFGSHTRTHAVLTEIPGAEAADEIAASKQIIENRLSAACAAFAYPEGRHDDRTRAMVRACYEYAFGTESGFVTPHDDPFALKRIAIHHDASFTTALFACKVSGLLDALSRLAPRRSPRGTGQPRAASPGSHAPAPAGPRGLPRC